MHSLQPWSASFNIIFSILSYSAVSQCFPFCHIQRWVNIFHSVIFSVESMFSILSYSAVSQCLPSLNNQRNWQMRGGQPFSCKKNLIAFHPKLNSIPYCSRCSGYKGYISCVARTPSYEIQLWRVGQTYLPTDIAVRVYVYYRVKMWRADCGLI